MYHLRPFFLGSSPRQHIKRNLCFFQTYSQHIQHGGKLGKKQDLMSTIHRILNQLHAHLQLGRIPFVSFIYQSRITANLPQSCDLRKDLQLGGTEFRIRLHSQH